MKPFAAQMNGSPLSRVTSSFSNAQPLRCRYAIPAQRPLCVASQKLDSDPWPGEDAPGTGHRHFPELWQQGNGSDEHKSSDLFDMRSASEVVEMFDNFLQPGEQSSEGAAVQDPHGAPAGEVARRYADSGPTTGNRRRPEAMIDRDVRDTERTSEHFDLRSASEVASKFAALPGAANNAVSSSQSEV